MQATYWIFSAAFVILWILFAIHCYRNDKIYRFLGLPPTLVKFLWLGLFLTLSPFALIAYLILGIFVKEKEYRSLFTHAAFILFILFCFIVSLPKFVTYKPEAVDLIRTQPGWQKKEIESGQIVPTFNPLKLKFHAGVIQCQNNISSISAVTSGSAACLPFSHVIIVFNSNSPLVYESALILMERLKENPLIETIEIVPLGNEPELGGLLADAWIRLGIVTNSEIMIPPILKLKTVIEMKVSREPYASMHGYQETYSLPFISYNLSCELTHQSETLSLGTGNSKYDLATKEIGKELFDAVNSFLKTNLEKYGSPPSELEKLHPRHREYNEPPLQIMRETTPVVEGYVPMAESLAYWKIPLLDDVHEEFDRLAMELEASDWKEQDRYDREKDTPYLRYKNNDDRIVVFTDRVRSRTIAEKPTHYIIQYEQRMSPESIKSEVKDIVAQGCSIDFLLMVRNWMRQDEELQRLYLNALEKIDDRRPVFLLQKAESYGYVKEYDRQWRTLHKALAAEQLMGDSEVSQSDIKNRIKKFKEKHSDYVTDISWQEIFESFGVIEMSATDAATIEREVQLFEPLAIYSMDDEGAIITVSAYILKNEGANDKESYSLRFRCRKQNGGSESTIGGTPVVGKSNYYTWNHSTNQNGIQYQVTARTVDNDRFFIRLDIIGEV